MLPENTLPLPTHQNLGLDPTLIPEDVDPKQIVDQWLSEFARHIDSANVAGIMKLLLPEHAYWRDILALTWNFRTFAGSQKIQSFLQDRLSTSGLTNISLVHEEYLTHQKPAPGLQWIQFFFKFDTGNVGTGLGIVRLVPAAVSSNKTIVWKAHVVTTFLEDLQGFPEKIGLHRDSEVYAGRRNWIEEREKAAAFERRDPTVLVIGGAQAGLDVAARLKMLDVDCLVVEKGERIGGNWIERYKSLKLHDPVWYDHMPYLPFPPNWPVFSPASKLANWLQYYAEAMELDVWLASTVTNVKRDTATNLWRVTVDRKLTNPDGSKTQTQRIFTVKHVVFAIGLVAHEPQLPTYPGMETFKGELLHAFRFKSAEKYAGKKVVVIGACTSAHDISSDCHHYGIDVTMYQRSPTYVMSTTNGFKVLYGGLYEETGLPTDIADRVMASFPSAMAVPLVQMQTKVIAQMDKDLLDGLNKRGFRTYLGKMDAGMPYLIYERVGGYYFDTGASQLIIDGKIKVSSGTPIKQFVSKGIELENGDILSADVVIFATGIGDARSAVTKLCDPDTASNLKPVWGLDDEGELRGVYRDVGVPGLWAMFGNLAVCRFNSKHVALQIKAIEENLFGERYEK